VATEGAPLDLAALAALADLADRIGYVPRRELHCHPSVGRLLMLTLPEAEPEPPFTGSVGALTGIPVTVKPDFEPGAWEIREDDEVTASGHIDVPPWVTAPAEFDVTFPRMIDRSHSWFPYAPPPPFRLSGIA
jgi:hypothetical protein